MIKTVYVVPHTHWDREWFFTSSKAKVYLLKDLKDVLTYLEKGGEFKSFLLDGQASLIEDYLKWRPQDTALVKKLVKEKKLILGPWYTQTDQFMVSGESIINNLRIGIQESDRLGGHMKIAYVPDSFGQESSMPQIYRGFHLNDAVLYRGFSLATARQSEFIWQGEDGSEVTVFRMACGYFVGGVVDETKLKQLMTEEPFKTIVEQATTNNLLFPNGSDMAPIRFDLPQFLTKLNQANQNHFTFKVGSLEDYVASVRAEKPALIRLTGEQDSGKDMRVHKSITSSRADLKQLNTKLQNYLSNIMEPILALGSYFGQDYPEKTVEDIWKKMFKNAAHDSMGNCVSDEVNDQIRMRYQEVQDLASTLIELTMRELTTRIKPIKQPLTLTVFNTLPNKRSGIVSQTFYSPSRCFSLQDTDGHSLQYEITAIKEVTELIKGATIQLDPGQKIYLPAKVYEVKAEIEFTQLPAFGYRQFELIPEKDQKLELTAPVSANEIANDFYRITVNEDGSLNILDKLNNYLYRRQAIIEENGDDGDSYNYSPAKKDLHVYSTQQKYHTTVMRGKLKEQLIIDYDFLVPHDLAGRARGIKDTKMPVQLIVTLAKASKMIDFKVKVDNRAPKSHRLCVNFASEIITNSSIADIQFGTVKRPLVKEKELAQWAKDPAQWQEKPIAINPMQSFIALSGSERCVAIAPQGVREYESVGENNATIRLTLFRTYGMLGKKDLLYRPGRASGDETVSTPKAQLNKMLTFDFGLLFAQTEYDQTDLANAVKEYLTPLQVYEYGEFLNGRLTFPLNPVVGDAPQEVSLFNTSQQLTVSTIQKMPHKQGYLVRLYNPKFHRVKDSITFVHAPRLVQLVDLTAEVTQTLSVREAKVELPEVDHAQFITVYFEF